MNHFDKIALALPAAGLDGVLLTGEYNRFYASGFATTGTDGVALVTTEGNFYFTDSRYIEAAENTVENATIGLADREKGYVAWLGEALALTGARRIGFEDETMTVAEHRLYSESCRQSWCRPRPSCKSCGHRRIRRSWSGWSRPSASRKRPLDRSLRRYAPA